MIIKGTIKRETDKAFCIKVDDGAEEWFPKSQMKDFRDQGDNRVEFVVPSWLADKRKESQERLESQGGEHQNSDAPPTSDDKGEIPMPF